MTDSSPIISLRNITREFEAGGETVRILDNVNLDIERGSFNVISGESGSGKTTLLRILGMLDTNFDGEYLFEDVSVGEQQDWYLDELRANNLGFIFQEGRLFSHLTLKRNIEVPLRLHGTADREQLDATVSELEPRFFSEREREKETLNLYPPSASGGQGQRGSIMRAIINKPSIILADEPTASLHGELKGEVVDHLRGLVDEGHTVIVVSHDEVFYKFGRQLFLDEGRLSEKAPDAERDDSKSIPTQMPGENEAVLKGWKPRAPFAILLQEAIRETIFRPIFLSLILVALIVGVCQVSVFASIIFGAQEYVNEKITEGSRLNRIQIKPKIKDKKGDDKFPLRNEILAREAVSDVVARRATTTRVISKEGEQKTYSVSGLHPNDPEYSLLTFVAGGPFSGDHDRPEVVLTTALLSDTFDTSGLADGTKTYNDFIGQTVTVLVNRYKKGNSKPYKQVPIELKVTGIVLNGEGGRQLYFPNTTLLVMDRLVRDRVGEYKLPDGAGVNNWPTQEVIAQMSDFPWEDSLHVYAREIREVLGVYSGLSKMGYKPDSDIWDFKWALDIQDTAWRVFLPLLGLIVLSVIITVAANIVTSGKLRETELALWRVLGMRRGDLVLAQVLSIMFSVSTGSLAGLGLGSVLITQTRNMLEARSLEAAQATGSDPQDFDAIFAPVSEFFWPVIVTAIAIGVLAALLPAIQTAKTDPARVLKS